MTVTDQSGKEFNFPADIWLASDAGKSLTVTISKGIRQTLILFLQKRWL